MTNRKYASVWKKNIMMKKNLHHFADWQRATASMKKRQRHPFCISNPLRWRWQYQWPLLLTHKTSDNAKRKQKSAIDGAVIRKPIILAVLAEWLGFAVAYRARKISFGRAFFITFKMNFLKLISASQKQTKTRNTWIINLIKWPIWLNLAPLKGISLSHIFKLAKYRVINNKANDFAEYIRVNGIVTVSYTHLTLPTKA